MMKNYKIAMCEGEILPKMISFSLPLMFSSILQLLFNAADIVVVGRFAGEESLAAVGSTSSLVNLMVNLFIGLSIGANVTAARFFGAKLYDDLSDTIHTSMMVSLVSGLIMTIVGFFCCEGALMLMSTPVDILPLAASYMRIYFLGMIPNMVYNFGAALLRASGDTKRPLYYLLISGILNVILNLIFVIPLQMGVRGVALATVISQALSALLIVRGMIMEDGPFKLVIRELRISSSKLIMILKIGVPAGFQGMLFSLSNVVIQSSVN
ncbi:MAG: polysaccharide biosynthesis C-terminal domain-containing protein, partial [Oscillospiraceae bacterium]|nr:polysaccharide biosynthesis C-terminal domain-containing protein [Oscillospiraceae bacterium]